MAWASAIKNMGSAGDIEAERAGHSGGPLLERELEIEPELLLRALVGLDPSRRVHILDSNGARPPDARFLVAGFDPFEIIEARSHNLRITRRGQEEEFIEGDVLKLLDERLERYQTPPTSLTDSSPVRGACIATFSYELAHQLHRLRIKAAGRTTTESEEPDAVLAFYDTLVVHDYARGLTRLVGCGTRHRLEQADAVIQEAARAAASSVWPDEIDLARPAREADGALFLRLPLEIDGQRLVSNMTRDEYMGRIERVKEHIAAGDIYQANLTQRITVALHPETTPERIFLRLRRTHPASFSAFIRRREDTVISASPERFLRVGRNEAKRRLIEAWPIKGTRARGANALEDERLRSELQGSEKDRAENVMIVDLMRNDLGRVCLYGSVEVMELCAIQEHPTLFHLVSKVRGLLRADVRAADLMRAAFPCGSITGAPKLRAMEIIDEMESVPRGLSMGAIGYFSFDGRLDLSVAIRTMTVREQEARFNVGGGIVADSDPALEYEESLTKARALLRALSLKSEI
jgi:para-aminobenzoate synthetase component 1